MQNILKVIYFISYLINKLPETVGYSNGTRFNRKAIACMLKFT